MPPQQNCQPREATSGSPSSSTPGPTRATRLSLCLIARDEARHLERCLRSVQGVVDEIVVIDTGSTDATPAIAAAHGAHVSTFAWCDDFAAARNASIERATGDWILVLDADEELLTPPDEARAALLELARGTTAGRVAIESVGPDGAEGVVQITRFFPRLDTVRYDGRVHEQLADDGLPLVTQALPLRVGHVGYSADSMQDRHKLARNIGLLELALRDAPDDGYLWYQLGRTRALASDLTCALSDFQRALNLCPDEAPWGPCLVEAAGYALRGAGHSEQALALVEALASTSPERPDTLFLAALCAADMGRFEQAEAGYRRCLELGPAPPGPVDCSPGAGSWAPAHNLAVLCELLGRVDEARGWYARALELRPAHGPSREGLERVA